MEKKYDVKQIAASLQNNCITNFKIKLAPEQMQHLMNQLAQEKIQDFIVNTVKDLPPDALLELAQEFQKPDTEIKTKPAKKQKAQDKDQLT